MNNIKFKVNCSKLLIVMHIFSLVPAFAIDNIEGNLDNQNTIKSSLAVGDELYNADEFTDKYKEQSVKENKDTDLKDENTVNADNTKNKDTDITEDIVKKDASSNGESIDKSIVNINNLVDNENNVKSDTTLNNDTSLRSLGFFATNGALTDNFNPDKKDYTALIKGTSTTFRFGNNSICTKSSLSTMDIYFNGELIFENVTGTTDKTYTLVKGISNILEIVVTAESGAQDTYTVTFEREGYSDTSLGKINFYSGHVYLAENFDPKIKNYIGIVKGNVNIVSFITNQDTFVKDPYATMDVYFNDELIFDDITKTPPKTCTLIKGIVNSMKFIVTAESGAQSAYIVTFKREGYNDASLGRINFYNGHVYLAENFDPKVKNYIGIVKGNVNIVSFITNQDTFVKDPYATMDVYFNDKLIFDGITKTPASTFELVKETTNVMRFVVTAESGAQDTYTVTFKREGYNDASLGRIKFYDGHVYLAENFDPKVKNYIGIVKGNANVVSFITNQDTFVKDPYATMDVYFNDELIFDDITKTPVSTFSLIRGITNVMKFVVTAENGDQDTYTVIFERELDSNTNIKEFTISKGSLELVDTNYIATMTSWQNISVSKLILEDSWADYKIILNDKKEIVLNEKFDLEVGENKLNVEVTSNDGTKKNYQVIFERIDNDKPNVSIDLNNCNWTNESVLIGIEAFDDSGIRYIELPDGEKIYSSKAEFCANQNGIYKFKIYDSFLNEVIESVEVSNIDKDLPKLELKASTTELTNDSVDILVEASDNVGIKYIETPDGKFITKSTLTYEVYEDGTYTFKVVDLANNEAIKSITLNNIDSVNPILATELSSDNWSNEELTLSIFAMSDKGIKYIELPDGSKIEDNAAKYGIKENGVYMIATESLGGNVTTEKVVVSNIDTELPSLRLTSSTQDWTNEDVKIEIFAEDNVGVDYIILPNGKTVQGTTYIYFADKNGVYEFTVVDLAGNKYSQSIEIENIDKNPPVIESYDNLISLSNNVIILDLSIVETPSGIYKVILPNKEEIVEPKENIIEYKVKYNDTYTFTVVDKAGNSIDVDVKVDNLTDKKNEFDADNNISAGGANKGDGLLPNTGGSLNIYIVMSGVLIIVGYILLNSRMKYNNF